MNTTSRPKPPSKLVFTAILSGSLTCILSLIYIILCTIALIYRFNCNAAQSESIRGSGHFMSTVFRIYFQDADCPSAQSLENITSDYSVFVLVTITLTASIVCLLAAAVIIAAVAERSVNQNLSIFTYGYIGVCIASLVVDLTFGAHFGVDYSYLTGLLNNFSPGIGFNYDLDLVRIGAFLLMVIVLKGFVGHVINLVLLVLLVVYLREYSKTLNQYEHSIHKLSVIKAFDPKRQRDSIQQRCDLCETNAGLSSNGGPHLNYGYMNDDEPPRSLTRDNSRRERDDHSTPAFDRSYSWQQGPAPAAAPRPFSYLEESRRQPSPRSSSPAPEPQWRRSPWQGAPPPVPAPDYSPQAPRRLKSALKPGYM